MENGFRNFVAIGAFGVASLISVNNMLADSGGIEGVVGQEVQGVVVDSNDVFPVGYEVIKEVVIEDFLRNYLDRVTPKSNSFKKLRKEHGREGLLERYCSAHELALALTFENRNGSVSEKEYGELGRRLSEKQHDTSGDFSRIDYLDKKVVGAFVEWGRFKTENFGRLLEASEVVVPIVGTKWQREEYIGRLHRAAYTRKEYADYVKGQNKANDDLYSAMKRTLNFVERAVGNRELKRVSVITNKVYSELLVKYFGKDGKN